ncbi:hypothetical protein CTheo_6387 [Ceratobasidium theobromae]|uniref:Uncharacterized protein n=1 Tax=Ceratobasidium theobromae TaxID=1582974 RepID=A0A5N5QEX7_9AGAM|nr:hypothetical protein CTheo_6387 [Ceratobasidium theobromae]
MDPPPPYCTPVAPLHDQVGVVQHDLVATIRQLSKETINLDNRFQKVYVSLKHEVHDASSTPSSNLWAEMHKVGELENTAAQLKISTTSLIDDIISLVANADETKAAKIDALKNFIAKLAPPLLSAEYAAEQVAELRRQLGEFTAKYVAGLNDKISAAQAEITRLEEKGKDQRLDKTKYQDNGLDIIVDPELASVDYKEQIKKLQANIIGWERFRDDVKGGVHEISTGLDRISDYIGGAFLALWSHEKGDIEHLKQRVECSSTGVVQVSAA